MTLVVLCSVFIDKPAIERLFIFKVTVHVAVYQGSGGACCSIYIMLILIVTTVTILTIWYVCRHSYRQQSLLTVTCSQLFVSIWRLNRFIPNSHHYINTKHKIEFYITEQEIDPFFSRLDRRLYFEQVDVEKYNDVEADTNDQPY